MMSHYEKKRKVALNACASDYEDVPHAMKSKNSLLTFPNAPMPRVFPRRYWPRTIGTLSISVTV
jgi:hypothetical protein